MEQVTITVPYAFIAPKVQLTWREVRFGIDEGLFSPPEVIDLATDLLSGGDESDAILDLASMRRDEPVVDVVAGLAQAEAPQEMVELRRLWAFLVLAWILEHQEEYVDPLDLAEKVYADLDYPAQAVPLIRYMPSDEPDLGSPLANEARLFAKWEQYVIDEGAYFASRKPVEN
jgi:hypothetical protein